MKFSKLKYLSAFVLMCQISSVNAATTTGNMTVDATVVASCSVVVNSLSFGNYSLTQLDASAVITPTCTNGTTYYIELSAGSGTGATTTTRKMTSGANTLNYSIYKDSSRATVWGTGTTDRVSSTGTGAAQTFTAYGRIPASQVSPLGAYTDTVVVTVTF